MRIKSKFNGRCTKCGGNLYQGEMVEWERGAGVSHVATLQYRGGRVGCEDNKPTSAWIETPTACHLVGQSNGNGSNGKVTVTMGVFRKDGKVYVVKPNKEKSRVYAKEIVESPARMTEAGEVVEFEAVYRPGAIYTLTEADRMELADAHEFLTKYARCIVCHRHLKAATSVANSIGPVCAKYFA